MGFEITYKFHEKLEEGGYDKEKVKELKKEIGEPFEDIPLQKLAAAIMLQLARRDVWVIDVEVTEVVRKKIKFKEVEGGISLKNKKFTLESIAGGLEPVQEAAPPPQPQPQIILPPQQPQPPQPQPQPQPQPNQLQPNQLQQAQLPEAYQQAAPQPPQQLHPIPQQIPQPQPHTNLPKDAQGKRVFNPSSARSGQVAQMMVYDPDPELTRIATPPGKFVRGKRYPVLGDEQPDPREAMTGQVMPPVFKTIDDTGRQIMIPTNYFVPVQRGLMGQEDDQMPDLRGMGRGGGGGGNDGLVWPGLVGDDVPSLRGGR
jgi:hypothetical protein